MARFGKNLYTTNAWQIRTIALACFVVLVGSSSQFLANAFAASIEPEAPVQQVTSVITVTTQIATNSSPSMMHVSIRRAGIDTPGGYTVTTNR